MLVVNVLKWYFAQINWRVEVDILYWFRRLVGCSICRFSIIFGVSLRGWHSVIAAALCVAQELELVDDNLSGFTLDIVLLLDSRLQSAGYANLLAFRCVFCQQLSRFIPGNTIDKASVGIFAVAINR